MSWLAPRERAMFDERRAFACDRLDSLQQAEALHWESRRNAPDPTETERFAEVCNQIGRLNLDERGLKHMLAQAVMRLQPDVGRRRRGA